MERLMTPALPVAAAPVNLAEAIQGKPRGVRWRNYLIVGTVILVLSLGGAYWWRQTVKARNPWVPYVTEPLRRGDIQLTITATGNLAPTTEVTVGSELSGTVLAVYVEFNDRVTNGMPLAKLDTRKLAQQTESSRASVRVAKARVVQSQVTVTESAAALVRQKELHETQLVSTSEYEAAQATSDRARADVVSAEAAVGESEAQLRINENDLTKAVILSPIDGIVLARSIEPGQTVAASFTAPQLFVIAEKLERMKLEVSIAEADIGRVEKGQRATFTVDAWPDRSYSALVTIVSYGSAVKDNVVTYEADLEVANDDLSLRPGMTATADIRVAERTHVFLVPAAALRFVPATTNAAASAPKKSFVQSLIPMPTRRSPRPPGGDAEERPATGARLWVLKSGELQNLPVQLGLSDGRYTEVSGAGLSEGLDVVLRANPSPP